MLSEYDTAYQSNHYDSIYSMIGNDSKKTHHRMDDSSFAVSSTTSSTTVSSNTSEVDFNTSSTSTDNNNNDINDHKDNDINDTETLLQQQRQQEQELSKFDNWIIGGRYKLIRDLGKGSYGDVYEAIDLHSNKKVAIKRMQQGFTDDVCSAKRLYREIYILSHVTSNYLVKLIDIVCPGLDGSIDDDDKNVNSSVGTISKTDSLLTEANLMKINAMNSSYEPSEKRQKANTPILLYNNKDNANGNLLNQYPFHSSNHNSDTTSNTDNDYYYKPSLYSLDLKEALKDVYVVCEYVDTDMYKLLNSAQYLTNEHIQSFMHQILLGLNHLHKLHVIHRDLKPANILINEDCSLRICDFGLARVLQPHRKATSVLSLQGRSSINNGSNNTLNSMANVTDSNSSKRCRRRRQLTIHVVTRWYRAPECILLQDYTSAVDIWSVGCILAELLEMQKVNLPYTHRVPLFPGRSCFPLSCDGIGKSAKENDDDRNDQLSVIFEVLGTPSIEDIAGIDGVEPRKLLDRQPKRVPKELRSIYPGATTEALNLLMSMLTFNPKNRITCQEALEHPYFADMHYNSTVDDFNLTHLDNVEEDTTDAYLEKVLNEIYSFKARVSG